MVCVHIKLTGLSHAVCNISDGGVIYTSAAGLDRCRDAGLARTAAVQVLCSTLAAASQLAVHTLRLEWVRWQLDPPATFSPILSENVHAVVDQGWSLHEESVKRYLSEKFATRVNSSSPAPAALEVGRARKTNNDIANQHKKDSGGQQLFAASCMCTTFSHRVQAGKFSTRP